MRRFALAAVAALLLLIPATVVAQDDGPQASVVHKAGEPLPGGKLLVQIEVAWAGRPDRHLPGVPRLEVPKGAVVRMGRSTSEFDGERTRWWTDAVVELPDKRGPYTLGPARVPLKAGPAAGAERVGEAVRVGDDGRRRALIGQGVGNGVVVLMVLLYVGLRWRSLGEPTDKEE